MTLLAWFGFFLLGSLIWTWILFLGGAETLDDSMIVSVFLGTLASATTLKCLAMLAWIVHAIWFVVGVFRPEVRA